MSNVRNLVFGASVTLLAAACSAGEESANEAEEANEASAADVNATANDPNNPFAQAESELSQRIAAASGANPSETWIRKMIEHRRGAVAMSDILLAQNPSVEVRAEAEETRNEQLQEISELESLLSRASATAAPGNNSTREAASAPPRETQPQRPTAEQPEPKASRKASPKSTPRPAPEPAAPPPTDPHAGHDMNNMSNMN